MAEAIKKIYPPCLDLKERIDSPSPEGTSEWSYFCSKKNKILSNTAFMAKGINFILML